MLLSSAEAAQGQTSANLALLSAYTARGVTLDTRPTPQLRVEHDADDGWYLGGFGSPVRLYGVSQGQLIAYGGRAQRLTSALTLDAGVSHGAFLHDHIHDYSEFYAGLALARASARLFYSPAYYGEGRTAYLDLNDAWPLGDRLTLAVHAGLLHPIGAYRGEARDAGDLRLALAADVGDVRLQAGWQATWRPYLLPGTSKARALTASASLRF